MSEAASVSFFVPGLPQPGGSKRAFVLNGQNRAIVTDANPKAKGWKQSVATVAMAEGVKPLLGPLRVTFEFIFPRPKGHYGSGKNEGVVRQSAPHFPTGRPDTTKCIRSTEDALKGLAWRDDSQIVFQFGLKRYAGPDDTIGAWITIKKICPDDNG